MNAMTVTRSAPRKLLTTASQLRETAEIAVRFAAHVQGIVPRHIEGQGLDGLCIAQIVQLLQKQDPDDNM